MGYQTYYTIIIDPKPAKELLKEELDGFFTIDDLLNQNVGEMKWYDNSEQMIELSTKYPEYLFILDGEGEETGDVWRSFFKNGKSYDWRLEYELPNFEEDKLQ